jgi:penicillin V acylase-like amidase (Ntn superfamily)
MKGVETMNETDIQILNRKANEALERFKKKHGIPLTFGDKIKKLKEGDKLTNDKFQALNSPIAKKIIEKSNEEKEKFLEEQLLAEKEYVNEEKDKAKQIDEVFSILDSLNIPNERKIAIANLLTGEEANLREAIDYINKELS